MRRKPTCPNCGAPEKRSGPPGAPLTNLGPASGWCIKCITRALDDPKLYEKYMGRTP